MKTAAAQRGLRQRAMQRIWPWLWLGPVVIALVIAVFAESRAQPASGEETLLAAAATKLGDALRTGDKSAVRRLLSLQFTFADDAGKVFQRKEFLSNFKSAGASEPATNVKVSVYGMVGVVTGTRQSAQSKPVFFLDIWAKQKGSWRALTMQNVMLGPGDPQIAAADPGNGGKAKAITAAAKASECKNPCEKIPYRVRSPAEQDVVTTLQEIAKAAVVRDADAWAKHVADDFMLYRSGHAPAAKAAAVAAIEHEKTSSADVTISEIETMRLAVYGDGAAMIASYASPDNSRPPYRAASVWAKRNGRWQLVVEADTDGKN
jgi:ketosteroid isomerase-like protein